MRSICLASQSPRRRQLLEQIGVPYEVFPVDIDESPNPSEEAEALVRKLARLKAATALARRAGDETTPRDQLCLGADTVVVLGTEILGKPADAKAAVEQLRSLSARSHRVLTAVAITNTEQVRVKLSTSKVWFRPLNHEEIARYCASGEPLDKAGSYGIQGMAAKFITRLDGSYSGVMGLPLYETSELLTESGWKWD